jgi:phospholipid transport system substrate-binding protein
MIRAVKALSAALLISAFAAPASVLPAWAADDPAAVSVQNFYAALNTSMKTSGGTKARFEKLKPGVEQNFDLQGMTALSVGPTWASISAADQKALVDAFERMTVANYARNFDSANGENFIVDPEVTQRGADKFVKSTLRPANGAPIAFNYRLHQVGNGWKIVDVYLAGNISQLAQKRADFASTLTASGPQGLAKKIDALADKELSG